MELTSFTNLAIETIFWAFVTLMIFDFVNGLFELGRNQTLIPVSATPHFEPFSIEEHELLAVEPQFEKLPNPWELELATQNNTVETQLVVLPFPTLRLLPPASVVLPLPTKKPKTKSTKTTKQAKQALTQSKSKPGRPRSSVA